MRMVQTVRDRLSCSGSGQSSRCRRRLGTPWVFALGPPLVLVYLGLGGWFVSFTGNDGNESVVEQDVRKLWTSSSSPYSADLMYLQIFSSLRNDDVSTFSAMAVAHDENENLMTSEHLTEIGERMKELSRIQISLNSRGSNSTDTRDRNLTFTEQDLCYRNDLGQGTGTTYRFSCFRLSPMDFFYESRWHMDRDEEDADHPSTLLKEEEEEGPSSDTSSSPLSFRNTWYHSVIEERLLMPRIQRYGIMTDRCVSPRHRRSSDKANTTTNSSESSPCDHVYRMRFERDYAMAMGQDELYATKLLLFDDIGRLESNDPCRICIESNRVPLLLSLEEKYMVLMNQVLGEEKDSKTMVVDRAAIEDLYYYRVIRQAYADLLDDIYMETFAELATTPLVRKLCPDCPESVSLEEARETLLNHADNEFSSVNTAGNPAPFWNPDTGVLFGYDEMDGRDRWRPFGGSGLNMGGPNLSLQVLLGDNNPGATGLRSDPGVVWLMGELDPVVAKCGNDRINGTDSGDSRLDLRATLMLSSVTQKWCNTWTEPFYNFGRRSRTHFARMWYKGVVNSEAFLGVTVGEDDPYSYTLGSGCGYTLTGRRFAFSDRTEAEILTAASGMLYNVDEGEGLGPMDPNVLMGWTVPPMGEYDPVNNPLTRVGSLQTVYLSLTPRGLVERVKNCNRPGGPILDLTEDEARQVLEDYKTKVEETWSRGWKEGDSSATTQNNETNIKFVGYFDDVGSTGTSGKMLAEVTLGGGRLLILSVSLLCVFSVVFLVDVWDPVRSRAGLATVGVLLVVLAFFCSLGLFLWTTGQKLNVTIGWTLPFLMIGLGVDNLYMVVFAVSSSSSQKPSTEELEESSVDDQDEDEKVFSSLRQVMVPVTLTSAVNVGVFGVVYAVTDVPAVYVTALAAMISVGVLWVMVILSVPAWTLLDRERQQLGWRDPGSLCLWFCQRNDKSRQNSHRDSVFYRRWYRPVVLRRPLFHVVLAVALLGLATYGWIARLSVGLGLEDFFPANRPSGAWARYRSTTLATWPIAVHWKDVDYSSPDVQLTMAAQLEDLLATSKVSDVSVSTTDLWISHMALWTTLQCDSDWLEPGKCGKDFAFTDPTDGSTTQCTGTWRKNDKGLKIRQPTWTNERNTTTTAQCQAQKPDGICLSTSLMHPSELPDDYMEEDEEEITWCPVFGEGWSPEKFRFCVDSWRSVTYGGYGNLPVLVQEKDENENEQSPNLKQQCRSDDDTNDNLETIVSPIPLSSGPVNLFAVQMYSHEDTVDMILETRQICERQPEVRCFLTGPPYDYWEQYIDIRFLLYKTLSLSVGVGTALSLIFLWATASPSTTTNTAPESIHPTSSSVSWRHRLLSAVTGSAWIGLTCALSAYTVVGLCALAGVTLTSFSVMSFVLSIGFVVEYSVHVVHRFFTENKDIEKTMAFLALPTFMSFASSSLGTLCLAFAEFGFVQKFFFRPLAIVMVVSYFYGCYLLPVLLSWTMTTIVSRTTAMERADAVVETPRVVNAVAVDVEEIAPPI